MKQASILQVLEKMHNGNEIWGENPLKQFIDIMIAPDFVEQAFHFLTVNKIEHKISIPDVGRYKYLQQIKSTP